MRWDFWNFLRKPSRKARRKQAGTSRRQFQRQGRRLAIDPLEERRLLSVATNVFAGLVDANLSNAANYSSGNVPTAGDNLVLTGYTQTNINNDLTGLALGSVDFATNYLNLGGNGLSASGDFIADDGVANATISAVIGGVNFTKTGAGTISLDGTNAWTGTAYVTDGTLVALTSGALPDGTGLVVGNPSAFLTTTTLVLNSFSVNSQGLFTVQYTINGGDATPFSIGVYSSADGTTPGSLLQTFDVSDPLDLVGGGTAHTATVDAGLTGLDAAHNHLLAKLDAYNVVPVTSTSGEIAPLLVSTSTPLAGTFQQGDGSVYVITSSDTGAKSVTVSENTTTGDETVTINGSSQTFQTVSAITVALDGGTIP